MLSYRHAFHAGNHADVLKHHLLFETLSYFNRKDKAYWYIDTHAGAGVYDLGSDTAQKLGEHRNGIARLLQADALPGALDAFRQHLSHCLPGQAHGYPGSPWWAQSLLREQDHARLFELHPADHDLLVHNMQHSSRRRRIKTVAADGFAGLLSLLPPPPRRAVVLIDPPYEQKQDYRRVCDTLSQAVRQFATGCYLVWYPCLSRAESRALPEQLRRLHPDNYLQAELYVAAPRADGFGMHGSGMWLINPPYTLAETLAETLPVLCRLLQQESSAHWVLQHQIP